MRTVRLIFWTGVILLALFGGWTLTEIVKHTDYSKIVPVVPAISSTSAPAAAQKAAVPKASGTSVPVVPPGVHLYDGTEITLPSGGWVVFNLYNPDMGLGDRKILLGPTDPRQFLAGGSWWQFGTEAEAQFNYDGNRLDPTDLQELRRLEVLK